MKTRIVVMTLLLATLGIATAQAHDGSGFRHGARWERGHFDGRGPWRREGPRLGYREPYRPGYLPAFWVPPLPVIVYPADGNVTLSLNLPLR
ncbi:MAG TPA: hypothetical protein VF848_00880 [Steroidobacteraceae bacterium]